MSEFNKFADLMIEAAYQENIKNLGKPMAELMKQSVIQLKPVIEIFFNKGMEIGKAQAVPEKDAIIKKLSDQLYAQEMKTSAARVLCETACELLDDYAHQDAMVILNDLEQAMKEPAND